MYVPGSRPNTKGHQQTLMSYKVIFTPEAEAQLIELYGYIATAESPENPATDLTRHISSSLVEMCELSEVSELSLLLH